MNLTNVVYMVRRMQDFPVGTRKAMRELSLGPEVDRGVWSWTFHDGSTYAAVAMLGKQLISWAAYTEEEDYLPVIGTYTDPYYRGHGLSTTTLTLLLHWCEAQEVVAHGDKIYASTWRWPKYVDICGRLGLRCKPWDYKDE